MYCIKISFQALVLNIQEIYVYNSKNNVDVFNENKQLSLSVTIRCDKVCTR